MRTRAALTLTAAVSATALAAGPAFAAPHPIPVKSGKTKVTVAPGVAKALLTSGIAPVVTKPGKPGLAVVNHKPTLTATYPITGGALTADPLGGTIKHQGGLKFLNVFNGRSLEVGSFTIDLNKGRLTGKVKGTKTRVPVFKLDLSDARVHLGKHSATAKGVKLRLTGEAAGALNATLKTKVFTKGLAFGTADTNPRF